MRDRPSQWKENKEYTLRQRPSRPWTATRACSNTRILTIVPRVTKFTTQRRQRTPPSTTAFAAVEEARMPARTESRRGPRSRLTLKRQRRVRRYCLCSVFRTLRKRMQGRSLGIPFLDRHTACRCRRLATNAATCLSRRTPWRGVSARTRRPRSPTQTATSTRATSGTRPASAPTSRS